MFLLLPLSLLFSILLSCNCFQGVTQGEVKYFLYTKNSANDGLQLTQNNANDELNLSEKIVFLIHGWLEDKTTSWYNDLRSAYLDHKFINYSVILVEWDAPAHLIYPISSVETHDVGVIIGDFIINSNLCPLKIELTGHSLGAQVAGFVGKRLRDKNRTLSLINGLDPAGPLFSLANNDMRLSRNDAKHVVVFHTDGGLFGFQEPCGTIDFFINGGSGYQPGCPDDVTNPMNIVFCSHKRSTVYFTEAIRTGSFWGTQCYSYEAYQLGLCRKNRKVNFGKPINNNDGGKFYIKTNDKYPYANVK